MVTFDVWSRLSNCVSVCLSVCLFVCLCLSVFRSIVSLACRVQCVGAQKPSVSFAMWKRRATRVVHLLCCLFLRAIRRRLPGDGHGVASGSPHKVRVVQVPSKSPLVDLHRVTTSHAHNYAGDEVESLSADDLLPPVYVCPLETVLTARRGRSRSATSSYAASPGWVVPPPTLSC